MYLEDLHIVNFKNFKQISFDFSPKINCFVGANGVGKTNVLDAIHYLSFCKSYLNVIDQQNINHDENFFMIEGKFEKEERSESVYCGLKRGQKKLVKKNQKTYTKLADHIGQFPLVIISPYDRDLISEGSEGRRRFIDNVIGQADAQYLENLIHYNRVVSQRNALLKYFAQNHSFDALSLAIYDEQMIVLGQKIHQRRNQFVTEFVPIFEQHHQKIANTKESVSITYESHLNNTDFTTILQENLAKDRVLQYSSVGIHKDDLAFKINHFPVKKFGSQGQQKSFTIALKLAQFDNLKIQKGLKPILLLDDVFDKLDAQRVSQIIEMVNEAHFGQIFITDTHPERMAEIVGRIHGEHKIIVLE